MSKEVLDALMQDDRNLVTGLDSIVDFYGLFKARQGLFISASHAEGSAFGVPGCH